MYKRQILPELKKSNWLSRNEVASASAIFKSTVFWLQLTIKLIAKNKLIIFFILLILNYTT